MLQHVTGARAKQARALLIHHHYRGTDGGSGYLVANVEDGAVDAAVLIGPSTSISADRSIVAEPWATWAVKRSFALDSCAVPESQALRFAMRSFAAQRDETLVFISYAEPDAVDTRTGMPMLGHVYMASGFFYIGETTGQRWVLIDKENRARSTRQGKLTITARHLDDPSSPYFGWKRRKLGAARVWMAVVSSETWPQLRRRRGYMAAWRALAPQRKAAARQWMDEVAWEEALKQGAVSTPVENVRVKAAGSHCQRLEAAMWPGRLLKRDASPAWPLFAWTERIVYEEDVARETTGNRRFLPRS